MTDVSVVVVNYRSAENALAAFASVRAETRDHGYELILVDNDEDGAGGERIARAASDVRVVRSGGNPGFGAGCNAGMAVARGRWVLLLNPDTVILDRAIDRCLDYLDGLADPRVAMLGCEHLSEDGSLQPSSFPQILWPSLGTTLANNALLRVVLRRVRPELFAAKTEEWQRHLHERTHDTDAVQGSFLLVRRDLAEEIGGFDPDFFLYYEELDWCRRVRDRGLRIVHYRDARIVHATRRRHDDPATERQAYLSEALFVLKRQGRLACALHVLFRHLNIVLGYAAYPLMSPERRSALRAHVRLLGFGRRDWLRPILCYGRRPRSRLEPLRAASALRERG
jgi:GT2 family glycosyltransferase